MGIEKLPFQMDLNKYIHIITIVIILLIMFMFVHKAIHIKQIYKYKYSIDILNVYYNHCMFKQYVNMQYKNIANQLIS